MRFFFILFFATWCAACTPSQEQPASVYLTNSADREIDSIVRSLPARKPALKTVNGWTDVNPVFHYFADTIVALAGHIGESDAVPLSVYADRRHVIYHKLAGLPRGASFGADVILDTFSVEFSEFDARESVHFFANVTDTNTFRNVYFYKPLKLRNNRYGGVLRFDHCLFYETFSLRADQERSFSDTGKLRSIEANVAIKNSKSYKLIDFSGSGEAPNIFKGDVIFDGDSLLGKVTLANSRFSQGKGIGFRKTTLPDTLDLSNVYTDQELDLTDNYPNLRGRKCDLFLWNSDIGKVLMNYENFHLAFPPGVADSAKNYDRISSIYKSLLTGMQEKGFENSYKLLDQEFKTWQSKRDWVLKLSDLWWKFGYEKWRIVGFSILLVMVFFLVNSFNYPKIQEVYPIENLDPSKGPLPLSPVKKSFAVFLYTSVLFFSVGLDLTKIRLVSLPVALVLLGQYLCGLVCTGFLINWILG